MNRNTGSINSSQDRRSKLIFLKGLFLFATVKLLGIFYSNAFISVAATIGILLCLGVELLKKDYRRLSIGFLFLLIILYSIRSIGIKEFSAVIHPFGTLAILTPLITYVNRVSLSRYFSTKSHRILLILFFLACLEFIFLGSKGKIFSVLTFVIASISLYGRLPVLAIKLIFIVHALVCYKLGLRIDAVLSLIMFAFHGFDRRIKLTKPVILLWIVMMYYASRILFHMILFTADDIVFLDFQLGNNTRSFLLPEFFGDLLSRPLDIIFGRGAAGTYYSSYFDTWSVADSANRFSIEIGILQLILKGGLVLAFFYILVFLRHLFKFRDIQINKLIFLSLYLLALLIGGFPKMDYGLMSVWLLVYTSRDD